MRCPSIVQLDPGLRAIALAVAEGLDGGGHGAWIVGGTVRDLALGLTPKDVDMATAATPEEIEALFDRTTPVGKAFGTVLVHVRGGDVQLTTFRSEGTYSDGRRPDEVRFCTSLEEDARRRDFTCNALYLDPRSDDLSDPENGLADLEAGLLRCVGDPARRFAEDGLRLLRMARFAAAFHLFIDPNTLDAARLSLDSLRGVSPERIWTELELVCAKPETARALELLAEAGVLSALFAHLADGGDWERRRAVLRRLRDDAPVGAWLAVLFAGAAEALEGLRAPRAVLAHVAKLWELRAKLTTIPEGGRAARIRLVREPEWDALVLLERAWNERAELLEELVGREGSLAPGELHPELLVTSSDLAAVGVPPGPEWGRILRAAEDLQLEGELATREEALAWLAARAGSGSDPTQDGGKSRRSP
ncbi:MAG: CCA tRNA nucleotidyltransferase [Planctomycetota bacterium]|nr:CCA tRNA nucleotidyltransferase [Planctomycetota bacterium]